MDAVTQSNFLQALGWAVLNSLWQMALLWVVYQVATGVLQVRKPAHKSNLASLLLFTGFAWFVYTFVIILTANSEAGSLVSSGFISVDGNIALNNWLERTLPMASVAYLLLLIVPVGRFIRNYRFVNAVRTTGLSRADVQWRIFARNISARMGIRKPVQVWLSEVVHSPVTIGYLKPVILLPLAAINNLTPQQLEAILLHELAHIRRADYLVNLFIRFIQTVLYFNPFVAAFVKIVEREREKCCDEMVMQFQYDPHGYASALLVLQQAHEHKAFAMAANGKTNDLLHRIEWIMGVQKKTSAYNKLGALMAGLLCIIALNALVILSRPSSHTHLDKEGIASFTPLSPLFIFSNDEQPQAEVPSVPARETHIAEPVATIQPVTVSYKRSAVGEAMSNPEQAIQLEINPFVRAAAQLETVEGPALTKAQEQQVKDAISASKRVLQEGQWKEVEKNIAEVFTQDQKDLLRQQYQAELNKLDLKKWEEKLRTAYGHVDWNRMNTALNAAVTNIKLDSLQHVYVTALDKLSSIQSEMTANDLTGIPDSDVTLKVVEDKKATIQKALSEIKAVRSKKVVRL